MNDVYICDAIRTPFGRYGGALSNIRTDDLAAFPIRAILDRNPSLDAKAIDDVILGCANQAGEDNRNIARMALLLAGIPETVPGMTVNRLCGSGMESIISGARSIRCGDASLVIAGGVESMSRAPYVLAKAESSFSRSMAIEDSTLGWRFINPRMKELYGVDSLAETAENVAAEYRIARADQDAFAYRSQQRAAAAASSGRLSEEIVPVCVSQAKGKSTTVDRDEHLRPEVTVESLAKLRGLVTPDGSVSPGNSTGLNDGAGAILLASLEAVHKHGLTPKAKIVASSVVGLAPRVMGVGPVPAIQKVLSRTGLSLQSFETIEINEAFAAQVLAVLRQLGLEDDNFKVNPNGGAIAIGHPLGASGARLVMTAMLQLIRSEGQYALCSMCIGVGQGIAIVIERV